VNCDVCVGNDGVYKVRLGFFFFFSSLLFSRLSSLSNARRAMFFDRRDADRSTTDH
jgi:hypothetical protein